ncbi:unnamed protein product [Musa acuminata subsp. burmannicoides]
MQLLGHIQSKNKLPLLLSSDSIYRHRGNYSTRDPRLACSSQLTTSSCVLLSSYFLELICLSSTTDREGNAVSNITFKIQCEVQRIYLLHAIEHVVYSCKLIR